MAPSTPPASNVGDAQQQTTMRITQPAPEEPPELPLQRSQAEHGVQMSA